MFALLLGAVGLGLSLPPFNLSGLAWVALVPLLVNTRGRRPLEAAGLAILTALVAGAVQVRWHPSWVAVYGGMIPFFWLALLLAVVVVAAGPLAGRVPGWAWALWTASLALALEWGTCLLPLPITMALTQHRNGWVLPLASITGAWGIALLVWWSNAALAHALLQPASARRTAVAALSLGVGIFSLHLLPQPRTPVLRGAVVQDYSLGETNVAPHPVDEEVPDREALTRAAASGGARVAVWTERCLGASFSPGNPRDATRTLARELRIALVPGYLQSEPGYLKPFNCAAWVAPDGEVRGVHHKIHPFMDEVRTIRPGTRARAFDTDIGRLGLEICFDTCYPAVTRDLARDGARLIAAPSIDPAVANGALHYLHSATLPLRAAEHGIPFLRADPYGLSQLVDRDGRVVAIAPLWKAAAPVGEVRLGTGAGTLYTRWGDWLPLLGCVLVVLLPLVRTGSRFHGPEASTDPAA